MYKRQAILDALSPTPNTIKEPGDYRVKYNIRFNSRQSKDAEGNIVFPAPGDWQDTLETGTATLSLRAADEESTGWIEEIKPKGKESQTSASVNDAVRAAFQIRETEFDSNSDPSNHTSLPQPWSDPWAPQFRGYFSKLLEVSDECSLLSLIHI